MYEQRAARRIVHGQRCPRRVLQGLPCPGRLLEVRDPAQRDAPARFRCNGPDAHEVEGAPPLDVAAIGMPEESV